jgi:hypothetical protein
MSDLFATIRARCAEVARRARHVQIDDRGLAEFADGLAASAWPEEDLDPAHHFEGDRETLLAFTLLLDAINFGSGWFPVLRKPKGLSGYRTVATACRAHFEREGAPDPETLRRVTPEWMASLLDQDVRDPEVAELMTLFAQAWRDYGHWLGERHGDRHASVVEAAAGSPARLVESLAEMPLYRDVSRYEELEVPLYKRAQITVADLQLAFADDPWGHFAELDRLTLFADNLVPHVLRCRGVLVYDPLLLGRIEAGELLEVGAVEEVEIRAVAVHAVERLVQALEERGRSTTAHVLDGLLWNAGQSPEIKAHPRHRARCSFY